MKAQDLPKAPVLSWSDLGAPGSGLSSLMDLPHKKFVTSGRAAIHHALKQLPSSNRNHVLVPTYHCPTMIAPVVSAGMIPSFYPLGRDGLPDLSRVSDYQASQSTAMLVPHLFGIGRSLATVRRWCNDFELVLIEDCAHTFYGQAGERSVGQWGDYAIGSLTKFFPIPEGGLLASMNNPVSHAELASRTLVEEFSGFWDLTELSVRHGHMSLLRPLVWALRSLKDVVAKSPNGPPATQEQPCEELSVPADCDMTRINKEPLWASALVWGHADERSAIKMRQSNFRTYGERLGARGFGWPECTDLPGASAPYAFPFWIEDGDRVYHHLRGKGMPVYRWDRVWPGTPVLEHDVAAGWRRHVIQLLCHQSLTKEDVVRICETVVESTQVSVKAVALGGSDAS